MDWLIGILSFVDMLALPFGALLTITSFIRAPRRDTWLWFALALLAYLFTSAAIGAYPSLYLVVLLSWPLTAAAHLDGHLWLSSALTSLTVICLVSVARSALLKARPS
ncbi:MAG TPA: hypothetical protein VH083_12315 [Myxococcales bacterium]|nr:hypothetical protein [Myxococcales bacterium]